MSKHAQKSEVFVNINENRLYILLKGSIRKKDLESIYTDVRFCVSDLKPGFDVITDMTDSNIGYLSGAPVFRKIAHYLTSNEVGRVVRIKNTSSVISKQIVKVTKMTNSYEAIYVSSMEEAKELLKKAE